MKITKCLLISTLFISAVSFADTPIQEQVTLPSIIDVVSFCMSDKTCTSITPVVDEQEINYDVKYETTPLITDPTDIDIDD
ncbi:MAG: hypothetical protein ACI9YH_003625 [Colwellia sp.]|jgi:hypothetical protein